MLRLFGRSFSIFELIQGSFSIVSFAFRSFRSLFVRFSFAFRSLFDRFVRFDRLRSFLAVKYSKSELSLLTDKRKFNIVPKVRRLILVLQV